MKEKYLITGFSGFVSRYFLDYLERKSIDAIVLGIDVCPPCIETKYNHVTWNFKLLNLLEKEKLEKVFFQFQPDYVLHLASYSSVAFSWNNPVESFLNNTNIFLNILEVIKNCGLKCRVLSVGSSEEYGNVSKSDMPLSEGMSLNPINPYAVARVSQELLSKVYVYGYNLDIIMTRSFNHIGPGQKETFVVSSIIKQLIDAKRKNKTSVKIITGNVDIVRDFTDVRDVVAAYYLLFKGGLKGEIYNVCSGKGYAIKELIDMLGDILEFEINVEIDSNLVRPNDNMVIIGSNDKLKAGIDWKNSISIERSLKDIICYWDRRVLKD